MLPKFLLFAGVASAFLVIPESLPPKVKDIKEKEEENAFNILPIDVASDVPALDLAIAGKSDVSVPCAECTHGDALRFHFNVADSTHLILNDFEIFPEPDPMRGALTAQVDKGTHRSEKLGYSIFTTSGGFDKEQGMAVADIEIKILAVGRKMVHRVPSVKITVLTAENGMLYIADTKILEPAPAKPKCHSMLCAFKEMLGSFKGRMGCHGGKAKSALKDAANQAYGHGVPAMHNAQQKAEEMIKEEHDRLKEKFHHHRGGIFRLVRNFISHVILPVILGISAGVGVAALAMVTANAIMAVTRCLCGRRDDQDAAEVVWYENVAAMGYPAGVKVSELPNNGSKDGLLENEAAAPEYYVETENEKA